MCAAGMCDDDTGLLIRKPTEVWASSEELAAPLRSLKCSGDHDHAVIQGRSRDGEAKSHKCRIWPWKFATLVASGIAALVRHKASSVQIQALSKTAYPTVASQAEPGEASPEPRPCKACQNNLARNDPRHTRDPDTCRFPMDEAVEWTCAKCRQHKPRSASGHTYVPGECKWATARTRAGAPRQGHHPRDPRQPATSEPTAALQQDLRKIRRKTPHRLTSLTSNNQSEQLAAGHRRNDLVWSSAMRSNRLTNKVSRGPSSTSDDPCSYSGRRIQEGYAENFDDFTYDGGTFPPRGRQRYCRQRERRRQPLRLYLV